MRKLILAAGLYIVWLLLTWPFAAPYRYQLFLVGLIVAAFVALFFGDDLIEPPMKFFQPKRYFWGAYYMVFFLVRNIHANFDVAFRVLHPALPIKPGVVKVRTQLKTRSGLAVLGNSITLTPGTTTIEMTGDGYLYVHWIYVQTTDIDEATRLIVRPLERILERVFE